MSEIAHDIDVVFEYLWFFLLFPAVLGFVFFIHEGGHYIAARIFNTKIKSFSVGFGKKVVRWTNRHGTEWSVSYFPFGGFVELQHEEQDKRDQGQDDGKAECFIDKPLWQKLVIIAAGPLSNLLLSYIAFLIIFLFVGVPSVPPVLSGVSPDAPAYVAGFKPGDKILQFEGRPVRDYSEITKITEKTTDHPFSFVIKRGDDVLTLSAPAKLHQYIDRDGRYQERGIMGVWVLHEALRFDALLSVDHVDVKNNPEKARQMIKRVLDQEVMIRVKSDEKEGSLFLIRPLSKHNKHLFEPAVQDQRKFYPGSQKGHFFTELTFKQAIEKAFAENIRVVTGVVYIFGQFFKGEAFVPEINKVTPKVSVNHRQGQHGFVSVFYIMALSSVIIGLINLLPVPLFDGGQMVKYMAAGAFHRASAKKVMIYTEYILRFGVAIAIGIVLFHNLMV